ncbi:MAG: hypothetical protein ABIO72_03990 [Patescibacteria group bacterium]
MKEHLADVIHRKSTRPWSVPKAFLRSMRDALNALLGTELVGPRMDVLGLLRFLEEGLEDRSDAMGKLGAFNATLRSLYVFRPLAAQELDAIKELHLFFVNLVRLGFWAMTDRNIAV